MEQKTDKIVNFTREPIIETIITPRDGAKLAVRSSKGIAGEEYFVDSLELVSFGTSLFYRSNERSKNFLLPVNDFEIVEIKEARMALKHVALEKNVKIGGGRDANFRGGQQKEASQPPAAKETQTQDSSAETSTEDKKSEKKSSEKKRESRRRPKRRRGSRTPQEEASEEEKKPTEEPAPAVEGKQEEVVTPSSEEEDTALDQERRALRSLLLVPPDMLISESLKINPPEGYEAAKIDRDEESREEAAANQEEVKEFFAEESKTSLESKKETKAVKKPTEVTEEESD